MTNEEYEDYIHGIYKKHYKQPVTYEQWSKFIKDVAKAEHKIQKKDNLWDLSHEFFKNNLLWSKLWVANHHIGNPHRIKTGNMLKFDYKTLEASSSSDQSLDIKDQFPNVVVPKSSIKQKRALLTEEIPSSLPVKFDSPPARWSSIEINFTEQARFNRIPISFYLSDRDLSGEGRVKSKDGYGDGTFQGEDIIISYDGNVSVGGVYTVFENRGSIGNFFSSFFGDKKGYEINVKGSIRILGYMQGSDSLYRARVEKSLKPISINDRIKEGDLDSYEFFKDSRRGSVDGVILGSPSRKRVYLDAFSIVYLNKGRQDDVSPGDVFYVKAADKNKDQHPYTYKEPVLGEIKVIHVAADTSTAIILSLRSPINIGDLFTASKDTGDINEESGFEDVDTTPELKPEEEEELEDLEDQDPAEDQEEFDEDEELDDDLEDTSFDDEDEEEDDEEEATSPVPQEVTEEFEELEELEDIEE